MIPKCPERPELDELMKKAARWWETATPEQKREMHIAQRRSWVIGEMLLDHPEMTREQILNRLIESGY